MSDPKAEFHQVLSDFFKSRQSIAVFPAIVKAVDETYLTCDVEDFDGHQLYDIRLRAAIDGDKHGVVAIPVIESSVLVGNIGNSPGEFFVVSFSKVTKFTAWVDTSRFEIDTNGLLLKRGEQTLKLILNAIIEQIKLITVTSAAPGSPTSIPINAAAFDAIKNTIATVFK